MKLIWQNAFQIAKEKKLEKYENPDVYGKSKDCSKKSPTDKLPERLEMKEKELREKLVKKFKHSNNSNKPRERQATEETEADFPLEDHQNSYLNDRDDRVNATGMSRGGRGLWSRRRRGNTPFRGNPSFRGQQFPTMAFPFSHRGGFFSTRGAFSRWPGFPPRGRGGMESGYFPPPFVDPFYLESAMSDPYYKYFRNITLGDKRSRKSRSLSRSRSRSSSYSRSYSRSRTHSRSQSRSRSRRRGRRSRSSSRESKRTRSRSKSRSRKRSRSKSDKKKSSRNKSDSPKHSKRESSKDEHVEDKPAETKQASRESTKKASSVHTWSKSPSKERSLSWEKQNDELSLSKFNHKQKKEKKKKKERKNKK